MRYLEAPKNRTAQNLIGGNKKGKQTQTASPRLSKPVPAAENSVQQIPETRSTAIGTRKYTNVTLCAKHEQTETL